MIKEYFNILSESGFDKNQVEFFQDIKSNLTKVEMTSWRKVFDIASLKFSLMRLMKLEIKQCYSNAANVCIYGNMFNQDKSCYITYCEGYTTCNGIVHEHAWNCLHDSLGNKHYFDVTLEYVLDYNIQKINNEEYCVVKEYNLDELNNLRIHTLTTGPYINQR